MIMKSQLYALSAQYGLTLLCIEKIFNEYVIFADGNEDMAYEQLKKKLGDYLKPCPNED